MFWIVCSFYHSIPNAFVSDQLELFICDFEVFVTSNMNNSVKSYQIYTISFFNLVNYSILIDNVNMQFGVLPAGLGDEAA